MCQKLNIKIKKYFETSGNGNTSWQKSVRHNKSDYEKKVHSNIGISQETVKISNKQSNFIPKELQKEEEKNTQN